jgi:hypothetical protein
MTIEICMTCSERNLEENAGCGDILENVWGDWRCGSEFGLEECFSDARLGDVSVTG